MSSRVRVLFNALMIVLLALGSAFSVISARADDGAPPPPAAEGDPSSATEAAAVTTPALSNVPSGTEVVVVDRTGHKLPLVSQEAAHIVASGDPMWCPAGVTPGGPSCSPAFTNFNNPSLDAFPGLLAWLSANTSSLNVNGVIWIAGAYDSSAAETTSPNAVTIDGLGSYGNMENFTLTIKGGWTGTGTIIDTTDPSNFDTTQFRVLNWNNDVSISDIVVQNVPGGLTALHVTTTKKINLTRVVVGDSLNVDFNTGPGAVLNNTSGTGGVTVASSTFAANQGGDGLKITSNGAVTLTDIDAYLNGADGVVVDNTGGSLGVTVTGSSFFLGNMGGGLKVTTDGAISLNSIAANSNHSIGVELDNRNTGLPMAVTLTGSNEFKNNSQGLIILSSGAVTLHNITANGNNAIGGFGVSVNNTTSNTVAPQDVTITGYGNFNNNSGNTGLDIRTYGNITLTGITADGNDGYGAYLNNYFDGNPDFAFGAATLPKAVTITGLPDASFSSNHGAYGLFINSLGAITLNGVTTDSNSASGAVVENDFTGAVGGVTFGGWGGSFSNNQGGDGLHINTLGAITVGGVGLFAWNNSGSGATLDNQLASTPKPVTINGSYGTSFGYNGGGNGLTVYSLGAITLKNLTVEGNNGYGAYLSNQSSTAVGGITLTGNTNIHNNSSTGLNVFSKGAISVNNVDAGNNQIGLNLSNTYTGAVGGVTISGNNSIYNNRSTGLIANSNGNILLNMADVRNNGSDQLALSGYGAILSNDLGTGNVTITGWGSFHENFNSGLEIYSHGTVTLANIYAGNNGMDNLSDPVYGYGVFVINTDAPTPKAVTLTGWNNFNNNFSGNLRVMSKGAITVSNLNSNDSSSGDGVYLNNNNSGPSSPQSVMVIGYGNFYNNGMYGLFVSSYGAVTLSNINAGNNGATGVYVNNGSGSIAKTVTINGNTNVNDNTANGLTVLSLGLVTLNNVNARSNQIGVYVGQSGGLTLNGNNQLNDNHDTGLEVHSSGNVLLNNPDIHNNGSDHIAGHGYGVTIVNLGNVTVSGSVNFHNNFNSGLEVYSHGIVTLSNINANNNGNDGFSGYGVYIDNSLAGSPKAVTLKLDNNFDNNYSGNLRVISKGAITVSNLNTSSSALGIGAEFNNTPGSAVLPLGVTLTGHADFNNNFAGGLLVQSYGAITLTNINEDGNGQPGGNGLLLDNSGGTIAKPVTINGFVNANRNPGGYGVFIDSLGAIKVASLNVDQNLYGASLDNHVLSPAPITLTGFVGTTNSNQYGMQVLSKGAITFSLADGYAGQNGDFGWSLNNSYPGAVGGITLSTNSFNNLDFNGNGGYGLQALSLGNIKITNLDADNNGTYGVYLSNDFGSSTGTVTLLTTGTDNNFNSSHGGSGLIVLSHRAITITDLNTDSNFGSGAILNNTSSTISSPQNVTLLGFSSNNSNGDDGLHISTYGVVTLNGLDGYDNGQNHGSAGWGAYIDNCGYTLGSCSLVTPKSVTLNGDNNLSNNYLDGLWITSLGAIKVNQVGAGGNGLSGAYLDNQWTGAVGGITITTSTPISANSFDHNGAYGLEAYSNGALTLGSIWGTNNILGGAYLDNCNDTGTGCTVASAKVTMTGRNHFQNNGDISHNSNGLTVYTDGDISINNLVASGNMGNGAYLDNCADHTGCTSAGNISLTGTNDFWKNNYMGLFFNSGGTVTMTRISSDNNNDTGVYGTALGAITVTCGSFTNNIFGTGLYLSSPAAITLIHVVSVGNSTNIQTAGGGPVSYVRNCPLVP